MIAKRNAGNCTAVLVLGFALVHGVWAGTVFSREEAGRIWQDGLFIGDGATGAMAYAPMHLEWTINRNDVLDTRVFACKYLPHDEVMADVKTNEGHSVSFLSGREGPTIKGEPDGDRLTLSMSAAILRIRFWDGVGWSMPAVPSTSQSLDTMTGELLERMVSTSMTPEALSFVERGRDVMAVEVYDRNNPRRAVVVEVARPDDFRMKDDGFTWRNEPGMIAFSQRLPGGETYAVAMSAAGDVSVRGHVASVSACGRKAFFIAVRTTRDAPEPHLAAIGAVKAAVRDGIEKIRADNRDWWRKFWQEGANASFDSEPAIDTQWHYSLYALAAQYGSAPMPGLNGLTYGPLDGGMPGVGFQCYVHDQNVQIPVMPFFALNHADFVRPFVKTYMDALPELERRTKEVFGVDGAYLPLNMNHFGYEHPVADYRYTLCGGAYSGLVLAKAWRYSRDEKLLREMYPLLKKFILFYTGTMTRDSDGTYRFIWSVPPEIFTGSCNDTATIACLKPCLETAIEAATLFGCDAKDCVLWKDILAHYPAFPKHPDGGWWCGADVPHDHYMFGGHLFYPFFPAESDTDRAVAAKTLEYTWRYAVEISHETPAPHPVHDWSALYTGMARIRLNAGADGWKALSDFYSWFAKPSGLFSHNTIIITDMTRTEADANVRRMPPLSRRNFRNRFTTWSRRGPDDLTMNRDAKSMVAPVIEGGAAFLLLASEALVQGWDGEVRLFPAVPPGFTGWFRNFRTCDGRTVSAQMKDGRLVKSSIEPASRRNGEEARR